MNTWIRKISLPLTQEKIDCISCDGVPIYGSLFNPLPYIKISSFSVDSLMELVKRQCEQNISEEIFTSGSMLKIAPMD